MNTASPRSAEIPGTVVLKTEWKILATLRAGELRRMTANGNVKLHFTSSSTVSTLLNGPKVAWQCVRAFSLAVFAGRARIRPTLIYCVRLSSNPSFFFGGGVMENGARLELTLIIQLRDRRST